ncbi:DUF4386 domain-containing protein [Lysinibacillus macroides]|uniref:DUF4386 domain-containing protein n=2 Tax=Lysinibacillus macroides TaxID=33935 RepID=A0A0M9DFY0_9BACI|nr:hypothetical protein ADM90_22850 [Lysinibacillus macroides]QPR67338.1 DUF4386 domain-containing protein [Lysinibacillus macroides]
MHITTQKLSSQRKSAFIGGIFLIIMAAAAFFSYGYAHQSLVVNGNAYDTFANLKSSSTLFKAEIFSWLIILIADIIVAWAFFIFLKPIHKQLALLAAWLRLIYTAILAIAIAHLILVLLLTSNSAPLLNVEEQAMLFLNGFQVIWDMGLIIFGGHLMVVGYITMQSSTIPKMISFLLLLAGLSYIIMHTLLTFFLQFEKTIAIFQAILSIPMLLGEISFGIWLVVKGGKIIKNGY